MKNILIILALSTLLMGCGDDYCTYNKNIKDKNLTAETQHGAQTMSCKIDGKVWVANGDNNERNCVGGANFNFERLNVVGLTSFRCSGLRANVDFEIDTNYYTIHNGVKRYMLGKTPTKYGINRASFDLIETKTGYTSTGGDLNGRRYGDGDGGGGWVEITHLDTKAQIVSGRFEFVGYRDTLAPVRITEGRFDWKYNDSMPCNSLM